MEEDGSPTGRGREGEGAARCPREPSVAAARWEFPKYSLPFVRPSETALVGLIPFLFLFSPSRSSFLLLRCFEFHAKQPQKQRRRLDPHSLLPFHSVAIIPRKIGRERRRRRDPPRGGGEGGGMKRDGPTRRRRNKILYFLPSSFLSPHPPSSVPSSPSTRPS